MNLLWDTAHGVQTASEQHLNVVPPGYRDIAQGIMAYHGQLDAAAGAFQQAVSAAPPQDGVDMPPGTASPDPETLPVTAVMPLAEAPQASVPANSAGR